MSPTIEEGWSVTARKVGPGQIGRGNIVVFRAGAWAAPGQGPVRPVPAMVRRVVGVGGDSVACCDATGKLTVNGKPVKEEVERGASWTRVDVSSGRCLSPKGQGLPTTGEGH
jgi:signal peptidase I